MDVISQEVGKRHGDNLGLIYIPAFFRERSKPDSANEGPEQSWRYEGFVSKLVAEEKPRVKLYEANLRSSRDKRKWKEWVKLTVTIDGLSPPVELVLVVSPNLTMHELHHVLCPSSKWLPFVRDLPSTS